MKASESEVTQLSVDGVNEDELPHWEIEDYDNYKEFCHSEWENEQGDHTQFIWQFRDKGETYENSYQAEEEGHSHEHDHEAEEAAALAANFFGVYTVNKRNKEEMEFSSTTTQGFEGQNVIIKIKKKLNPILLTLLKALEKSRAFFLYGFIESSLYLKPSLSFTKKYTSNENVYT